MTFLDIVNLATGLGFANENKPKGYTLKLDRKDKIVQIMFPDDSLTPLK